MKVTASGTGSKMSLSHPSESLVHNHPSKRTVCSPAAPCPTSGLDPDPKDRFLFLMCSPDFCPFCLHPGSHPGCSFYDSARTSLGNTSLCCDMTDDVPLRLCCLHRSQNPLWCFMILCRIQRDENREKNMSTIKSQRFLMYGMCFIEEALVFQGTDLTFFVFGFFQMYTVIIQRVIRS